MHELHKGHAEKLCCPHTYPVLHAHQEIETHNYDAQNKRTRPMAVFTTNRTLTSGVHPTNFFAALVANVMTWNDSRMTRNALSALTSRELDDIGLSRGDIANF